MKAKKSPFLGLLLLIIGGLILWSGINALTDNKQRLFAPNGFLTVEVADTKEARFKGLSGRESIGDEQGVLFVFEQSSKDNCLTMRDMNFPIDMVWMDENKKVINVVEQAKPESYPEIFCPTENAKYALELNAAKARDFEIKQGVTLRF